MWDDISLFLSWTRNHVSLCGITVAISLFQLLLVYFWVVIIMKHVMLYAIIANIGFVFLSWLF